MLLYHSQEIMESAFMHLHKICMCIQHKMETLRQNVNVIYRHDCNIHQTCRSLNLPSKYGCVEKNNANEDCYKNGFIINDFSRILLVFIRPS